MFELIYIDKLLLRKFNPPDHPADYPLAGDGISLSVEHTEGEILFDMRGMFRPEARSDLHGGLQMRDERLHGQKLFTAAVGKVRTQTVIINIVPGAGVMAADPENIRSFH